MEATSISANQTTTTDNRSDSRRRLRSRSKLGALAGGIIVSAVNILTGTSAHAQVPAVLVLQQGQMPPGGNGAAVTGMFNPATNGLDQVAVAVTLDSGDHGLFLNNDIGFLSSTSPLSLTLATPRSVGHSDTPGPFVYAPFSFGDSTVLTDSGALLTSGDPAPGDPSELLESFILPKMLPDGTIYFLAGVSETNPDFFYMSDGTLAGTTILLRTGDVPVSSTQPLSSTGGLSTGPAFYDVSTAGEHYVLGVNLAPNNLEAVVVDGALSLQQGNSTGDGDDWLSFHEAAVNTMNDVVLSARTTSADDDVIAVNNTIVIREGDTVGGVTLGTPAQPEAISVNDNQYAAHLWTHSAGSTLFFSCDVGELATTSEPLLSTGDMVAIEGGGTATVTALNGTFQDGPAIDLAGGVNVYARVELDDGNGPLASIIQLEANCCGNGIVDSNEQCDDGNNVDNDGCSSICATENMGTGGAGGGGMGGTGGVGGAGGAGGGPSGGRPAVTGGCDCVVANPPGKAPPWQLVSLLGLCVAIAGCRRNDGR